MRLSLRYWEGVVEVRDAVDEHRLGLGYLELTGYR